jgi:hypothetical protein
MGLFSRKASPADLAPGIATALDLARGERVLAFAVDDLTGAYVVATTYALAVVTSTAGTSNPVTSNPVTSTAVTSNPVTSTPETLSAKSVVRRRWLSVDAGAWAPETATLTVTWADGGRAGQWSFRDQQTLLPETLRERVQASVVLSTRLALGDRRTGRVAIRQDFATRELIPQTILGRYARADDPEVQAHVQAALAHLKDQVGLPA